MKSHILHFVCIALLSGCAAPEVKLAPYINSTDPDSGVVEFVNKSPGKGMNMVLYDNSTDCSYPKYVALFDGGEKHSALVKHKREITAIAEYVNVSAGYGVTVQTCADIYTVPFEKGDLRITSFFDPEKKACATKFESTLDGSNWELIKDIKKRTRAYPTAGGGGGFCRKEID